MQVANSEIAKVYCEAKNMRDALYFFYPRPTSAPYSMDELEAAATHLTNRSIRICLMDFEGRKRLRGKIVIKSSSADIVLDETLEGQPLERWVAAKEIAQLVLSEAENVSISPSGNLEVLVQCEQSLLSDDFELPADSAVELLSKYLAIEFLFPYEDRKRVIDASSDFDLSSLSKEYGLPEYVIEFSLGQYFMELSSKHISN